MGHLGRFVGLGRSSTQLNHWYFENRVNTNLVLPFSSNVISIAAESQLLYNNIVIFSMASQHLRVLEPRTEETILKHLLESGHKYFNGMVTGGGLEVEMPLFINLPSAPLAC